MKEINLPPAWCSAICRNALNEICVENCALKRDTSGFEPKPNLKLIDMPKMPEQSQLKTPAEKFACIYVYTQKMVEHLQGEPNGVTYAPELRDNYDTAGSGEVSKAIQIKDILPVVSQTVTVFQNREEHPGETERLIEVDRRTD